MFGSVCVCVYVTVRDVILNCVLSLENVLEYENAGVLNCLQFWLVCVCLSS